MAGRYTSGHRWRQLRKQVLAEEDRCALCGGWVDQSLPAGHPFAPEVDHRIPFAEAPELVFARENVQLVHRCHNRAKSNRLVVAPGEFIDGVIPPRRSKHRPTGPAIAPFTTRQPPHQPANTEKA